MAASAPHARFRTSIVTAALLAACGGASGRGPENARFSRAGPVVTLPDEIDDAVFREARRALSLLPDDDPARAAPLARLVEYLAGRCEEAAEADDRDATGAAFDDSLSLYSPVELARRGPSEAMAPCARRVVEVYSPPGDEARVAVALIVLARLEPDDRGHRERLDSLLRWSREARQSLGSIIERHEGLVEVYESIVERIPTPEMVRELSDLYVERHRRFQRLLESAGDGRAGLSLEDVRAASFALARTSYDIGRLYARIDDPRSGLELLESLGDGPGVDPDIIAALEHLESEPLRGLLETASIYGRNDPSLALATCRRGRLLVPDDARFAECMGQVVALEGDPAAAAAHYEDAMRLDPDRFDLFDGALVFHTEAMEQALGEDDPSRARASFDRVVALLERVRRQWRGRRISIEAHVAYYRMGMGEFNAGHIEEAVRHFEASADERPNRPALYQLGTVAERRGQWVKARRFYRKALDLRPDDARSDEYWRALLLERLADSHAGAGDTAQATRLYREALRSWDLALRPPRGVPPLGPGERATAALRKAVLFDRLGEAEVAREAFEVALSTAQGQRDVTARLLSYLSARARAGEALEVYRRALRETPLSEEWRIYYSLWVVGAQLRVGETRDDEPLAFLRGVRGDSWQERLARFYAGSITYTELLANARGAGERAEAQFYQAVRLLADGRTRPAAELLRQVIESDMMGFFEYEMAREILTALR